MNYIKRAIQSLWAKKGRSIIMITVFSAILIFVLAGLTIRSGAELATTNAKKSVGGDRHLINEPRGNVQTAIKFRFR